jgi:hypothetical protein
MTHELHLHDRKVQDEKIIVKTEVYLIWRMGKYGFFSSFFVYKIS